MIDTTVQNVVESKITSTNDVGAEKHSARPKTELPPHFPFMTLNPAQVKALTYNDYCLVSYPRSGNTWTRLMICHALLLRHGITTKPGKLPIPSYEIIPDLHNRPLERTWTQETGLSFRLSKSHDISSVSDQPIIYVFRSPVDSLVSYYFYHQRDPALRAKTDKSIDNFCLSMQDEYAGHLQTAISIKKQSPERVLFISYELLHRNTLGVLRNVFDFMRLPISSPILEKAIEHCQFEILQQKEKIKEGFTHRFMRQGQVGKGKEHLSVDTSNQIESRLFPIYRTATKLLTPIYQG